MSGISYKDLNTTLNDALMPDYAAAFIGRASGDSMQGRGIFDGDLLIIDRAVEPKHDDVIVAQLNGEFVCKILDMHNRALVSANPEFKPWPIQKSDNFSFEGVVTSSVRLFRSRQGMKSSLF